MPTGSASVHDVAGFTPLHHCAQKYYNEVTNALAEIILEAGGDVNARNLFGETSILNATMSTNYELIELLLKHDADPFIGENNKNISAANYFHMFPKMNFLFGPSSIKKCKEDRIKIKETVGINNCVVCRIEENGNKRCTGCYYVFYCSRECQVQDWDSHKEDCKVN